MRDYQPFMVVRTVKHQILLSTYLHANNAARYNFMNAGGRLSSCGTLALPHNMWNLPRPIWVNTCPLYWQMDSYPLNHQTSLNMNLLSWTVSMPTLCFVYLYFPGHKQTCPLVWKETCDHGWSQSNTLENSSLEQPVSLLIRHAEIEETQRELSPNNIYPSILTISATEKSFSWVYHSSSHCD